MFEVKLKKNKPGRHVSGYKIVFVRNLKVKYVAEGFQNRISSSMLYKVIMYNTYNNTKNTIIILSYTVESLKSISLINFTAHGYTLFVSLWFTTIWERVAWWLATSIRKPRAPSTSPAASYV